MAEPSTDSVDVNAGAKKKRGSGTTDPLALAIFYLSVYIATLSEFTKSSAVRAQRPFRDGIHAFDQQRPSRGSMLGMRLFDSISRLGTEGLGTRSDKQGVAVAPCTFAS